MPALTKLCPNCGSALEMSPVARRFYAVGQGSPHYCAIVELAPPTAIECCCGAHVERDRDGVKWEHGEPHVCSVRMAVPAGVREHSPTPERVQKASVPGSSGTDSRTSPAPRVPPEAARPSASLPPIYQRAEYRR